MVAPKLPKKPRKPSVSKPKRASKPRVSKGIAVQKKVFVARSVDDFTMEVKTDYVIGLLMNVDTELFIEEEQINALGSLQVEVSRARVESDPIVMMSKREFAIMKSCQKETKVEA